MNEDMEQLRRDCRRYGYQQAVSDIRTAVANQQSQIASIMIARTNMDTPSDPKLKARVDELSTVLGVIDHVPAAKRDADNY